MHSIILSLQQSLCLSIIVLGLFLAILELRTKFERSFLFFGIAIMLLGGFAAIDLWHAWSKHWVELQHVLFALFPPVIMKYLSMLTRVRWKQVTRLLVGGSALVSLAAFSGIMFQDLRPKAIPTLAYYFIVPPYLLYSIASLFAYLLSTLARKGTPHKKVIFYHFAGLCILAIAGGLDLLQLSKGNVFFRAVPSFAVFGALAMGSALAYFFTERLILLIRERMDFTEKLQQSYRELEHARSLSEIGRSTAIINHEIKNYTCVISGYAQFLLERAKLKDPFAEMAKRIIETATKLTTFSNEILDFSKAKILKDKRPLSIGPLIQRCIDTHWPTAKDHITYSGLDPDLHIHGEWNKLEHVFVNLIKNAFEAEATRISIRFVPHEYVLLIAVEDDGVGCDAETCPKLFEAFRTTKETGTGLGLPTSRAIVEAHGGRISAMSKNVLENGQHGLVFTIVFPTYAIPDGHKDNIVFVKNRLDNLSDIIRVFQNVFVSPHVIESVEELKSTETDPLNTRIIASPSVVAEIVSLNLGFQCYSLVNGGDGISRVVGSPPDKFEGLFSEEFILDRLLANGQHRCPKSGNGQTNGQNPSLENVGAMHDQPGPYKQPNRHS